MGSTHQHPSERHLQPCKSAPSASFLHYVLPKIMQILVPVRDRHSNFHTQFPKPFFALLKVEESLRAQKELGISKVCFKGST